MDTVSTQCVHCNTNSSIRSTLHYHTACVCVLYRLHIGSFSRCCLCLPYFILCASCMVLKRSRSLLHHWSIVTAIPGVLGWPSLPNPKSVNFVSDTVASRSCFFLRPTSVCVCAQSIPKQSDRFFVFPGLLCFISNVNRQCSRHFCPTRFRPTSPTPKHTIVATQSPTNKANCAVIFFFSEPEKTLTCFTLVSFCAFLGVKGFIFTALPPYKKSRTTTNSLTDLSVALGMNDIPLLFCRQNGCQC